MKTEVVWRLITAQMWPNTSGFARPFGVSLTKRQHQRCSLNLSVNWDLNDWGGRWCLQQQQRNLLDSAGMGRKAMAVRDPWLHFCLQIEESSLWSCWTCSCIWLALLWLCSLVTASLRASPWFKQHALGSCHGKEPIKPGTRGGQLSLVLSNLRKIFLRGSSRKTTLPPRPWDWGFSSCLSLVPGSLWGKTNLDKIWNYNELHFFVAHPWI